MSAHRTMLNHTTGWSSLLLVTALGTALVLAACGGGDGLGVSVPQPNAAPVLSAPSGPGAVTGADPAFTATVTTGGVLDFSVTATDGDATDTLTFTVTVTGGTLSAAQVGFTQTFTGGAFADPTPGVSPHTLTLTGTAATVGTIELTIVVNDGRGGTDTFTHTITIPNTPPVLGAPSGPGAVGGTDPAFTATVTGALDFTVTATDGDAGDTLTFTVTVTGGTLTAAQAGFTQTFVGGVYTDSAPGVSPHTLALSGTAATQGTIALTIDVADGNGGSDTITHTLTITNVVPVLGAPTGPGTVGGSDPAYSTTIGTGASLFFKVTATDADLTDTLTITVSVTGGTLTAAQAGFVQTFTGGVYNDPSPGVSPHALALGGTAAQLGTIELTFVASDGNGGSDTITYSITIVGVPGVFLDSGQTLGASKTQSLALGDVDGDGDLDLVIGNEAQANRVWLNDGTGTFTDSGQALGTNSTYAVALGDVDGDGDLDFVTGNLNQGNRVWLNDGAGTFTDSGQALGTNSTFAIALGDVDGDGDLDLTDGALNKANYVWFNNGAGIFTDSGQRLGTNGTYTMALGDVDGDSDLDLVTGNLGQGNRVWLNDGAGTFTDSGQALGTNATFTALLRDIDGDSDLDLVAANRSGTANRVYFNNGSGTFSDSGQALGASETQGADLGDVDGDGDLDLVTGNLNQSNRVYLNDGTGTFTDSGQALGTNSTSAVALGDLDGDGDLDLVAGNYGQPNRVYING